MKALRFIYLLTAQCGVPAELFLQLWWLRTLKSELWNAVYSIEHYWSPGHTAHCVKIQFSSHRSCCRPSWYFSGSFLFLLLLFVLFLRELWRMRSHLSWSPNPIEFLCSVAKTCSALFLSTVFSLRCQLALLLVYTDGGYTFNCENKST